MKKLFLPMLVLLFILSNLIHCDNNQDDNVRPGLEMQGVAQFQKAKPVWIKGRETEMNLTLGFRESITKPKSAEVILRITASTLYRIYLNGQFIGHGPARAAHGFYRIDEWPLAGRMKEGLNTLAIEVAGYNVNSYYLLDQPAFLQAEVASDDQVLSATGSAESDFEALIVSGRVQKVPRFSFQRPFTEYYRLNQQGTKWRNDDSIQLHKDLCAEVSEKNLMARGVTYAEFKKQSPKKLHSQGKIRSDAKVDKLWKDRSLTKISEKFSGYKEDELTVNPSFVLQKTKTIRQEMINGEYHNDSALNLSTNTFSILDLGVNLSGFIGATITCEEKSTVYFAFDEILSENDVNFRRLGCINIVGYDLEPGSYNLESFEPYTLRYLKIIVLEGACEVTDIYLREYVNADIARADFHCSNDSLNQIYEAGRETFRQNAIDIFMDCPSRERAGWLCDSYFTARVAMDLSGNTLIEKNFYENYLMPEKFDYLPEGMLPMCYPADHPDGVFIPNWAMWFVVQLEEYMQRSADRNMVDALKPKVLKLFNYFEPFKNEDGLLENLESWIFVEWSEANKFVRDVNYPTNMLFAATLDAAGRMYQIPAFTAEAKKIRQVIQDQAFNGKFFIDNAVRNDKGKLTVTQNSTEVCQYYAFFFDIASPESHSDLWQTLLKEFNPGRKTNRYPDVFPANAFIGNYLRLELLSRYGHTAQLAQESMANFYYMAERTGTLWENTGAYASCNHGFASHAVHVLYRDILGIYHIDYQQKKITLRFTDTNLNQCRGQIPIGDQIVELAWWKEAGTISYKIGIPEGYEVDLINHSGLKIDEIHKD